MLSCKTCRTCFEMGSVRCAIKYRLDVSNRFVPSSVWLQSDAKWNGAKLLRATFAGMANLICDDCHSGISPRDKKEHLFLHWKSVHSNPHQRNFDKFHCNDCSYVTIQKSTFTLHWHLKHNLRLPRNECDDWLFGQKGLPSCQPLASHALQNAQETKEKGEPMGLRHL